MMNNLAKLLVLLHTVLSVAALIYALVLIFQARDFGWREPRQEVLEYDKTGNPTRAVRHASIFDKSAALRKEAEATRDRTFAHVQPALDSIRATEPFLPTNHLFYRAELERLKESPDDIEVKRLKDRGMALESPEFGKPVYDDNALAGITKSRKTYEAEWKQLLIDIDKIDTEIHKIASDVKKFTAELTGTDEKNQYVHPGLYQLTDLEFKAQAQLKAEMEAIKPSWSQAIEQSRLFLLRRADLERSLKELKSPAPKDAKKL